MTSLRPIDADGFRYTQIIGTGGIGSGIFFSLKGDHTLGRSESRAATLHPYRDYCKQHIILHYLSVLLGASRGGPVKVIPIGAVGSDEIGMGLLREMEAAGMDTEHVEMIEEKSTLFSVCFQYPDKSGGNITADNSASSRVMPQCIESFFSDYNYVDKKELIITAPEVPIVSRIRLLEYGRKRGAFNVACVLSAEAEQFQKMNGVALTDLLSVNIDEARAMAKISDEQVSSAKIVERCVQSLIATNPNIIVLITDGKDGSYCYAGGALEFVPALKIPAASTAGAGDAYLAGTVAGLCCGLPLTKGVDDKWFGQTPLRSAIELGTLLAGLSVNSVHTIHPEADAKLLYSSIKGNALQASENFLKLFKDEMV